MRSISEITIHGKPLQEILDAHYKYLTTSTMEGRANLSGANLSGAYLRGADLRDANLSRANLGRADLRGADLRDANLSGADLSGANLSGADLSRADLSDADLSRAVLSGADLSRADLSGANLSGADLSGAVLSRAKNIPDYVQAVTSILPDGPIIGWKKCNDGVIVKMQIPAKAKRSNATGRKCRAEYVKVLALYDCSSETKLAADTVAVTSAHGPTTEYRKGHIVKPDSFDEDRWKECSHGVHFFISRLEAEEYV
jgi:hypothetical protein